MKILFVSKPHAHNFIRHYAGAGRLAVTPNVDEVRRLASDADVIIFEWGNDFTARCIEALRFDGKKVVVRVHDHEVRTDRVKHINWSKVDAAWFINRQIQADFFRRYPGVKSFFLPNAIDPAPFTLNENKKKKVGFLSIYARKRKRIDRALYIAERCPAWEFVFRMSPIVMDAGNPAEAENLWSKWKEKANRLDNVTLDLRPDGFTKTGYPFSDVNDFWQDKAVVLSTSEHEGFHYAIAEGALTGAVPLVFDWEYGQASDFWQPFVYPSLDLMCEALNAADVTDIAPASNRAYVEKRFTPEVLIPQLKEKLSKI